MSARDHYQHGYGHRGLSGWGVGPLRSKYAEGDIVWIAADCPAFYGRIPHTWSGRPHLVGPGRYRVTTVFSTSEGDDWYYRVCPMSGRSTLWDETSDRLPVFADGSVDFTWGWALLKAARVKETVEE